MDIYLHPTYIKLNNFDEEDMEYVERLKKYLSVWDTHTFRYSKCIYKYDEEKNELIIPGATSIETLRYYFPDARYHKEINKFDEYKTVNKYVLLKPPRDDIQKQALKYLKRDLPQKYLCLQTGQGKSYCAINYCHYCGKLPMVIVDQESLLLQWSEKIKEYTSVRDKEIYTISGKNSINKLRKMKETDRNKIKFYLAYHKTLGILFEENLLEEFMNELGIGLKIFDEAHLYYENIFNINFVNNIETILLSATPKRPNETEDKIYQRCLYSIPFHKTNFTERYLNVALIKVKMNFRDIESAGFYGKRGFDAIKYANALNEPDHIEHFQNIIINSFRKVYVNKFNKKRKIALIFKLIKQTEMCKELLDNFLDTHAKENNYERVLTTGILTGKTPSKQKREVLNNDIIITTDSSFSKAIDVEGLEIIINFVPVGSEPRLNQLSGRLRKHKSREVFFVDIIDISVKGLINMSEFRKRYYKKIAKKIYSMNGYGVERK